MLADCTFDICQLWNGLLLGTVASVLAATFVWFSQKYWHKKNLRQKYGKVAGKYFGYGFEGLPHKWTLKQDHQSEATITYIRDNILSIELTGYPSQGDYKWTGVITMDLETYGTIAWHYEIIGGKASGRHKHEFGFKRIMIKSTDNVTYIYLVEEGPDRGEYDKEILVKQN